MPSEQPYTRGDRSSFTLLSFPKITSGRIGQLADLKRHRRSSLSLSQIKSADIDCGVPQALAAFRYTRGAECTFSWAHPSLG
jgi:hypothetical protein